MGGGQREEQGDGRSLYSGLGLGSVGYGNCWDCRVRGDSGVVRLSTEEGLVMTHPACLLLSRHPSFSYPRPSLELVSQKWLPGNSP